MKIYYFLLFIAAFVLLACGQSHAGVNFDNFSSTAGLQLNGNAAQVGSALRIVPAAQQRAGSAFTTSMQNISVFSTSFKYQITNSGGISDGSGQNGADGITFTIQSNGPGAFGGSGGGLGYYNMPNSVAIEFDTWNNINILDPDSNHVGVNTNGSVISVATISIPGQFNDGTVWYAWIEYDGTTLEVRTNNTGVRPAHFNLSIPLDIPGLVGTSAYVGFTGGTGGAFGDHDLLCWNFNHNPPVAVCQGAVVAVGEVPDIDGGSYDPDGDMITLVQSPAGSFSEAGIYEVTLTVTDPDGAMDSCTAMVVVYDPSAGFVTGGGWIDSPEGALPFDPTLMGKANFGFVSKYKKGASIPTGNTEFQFHAGGLNFHSKNYDWLVVTGSSYAKFKGIGTILDVSGEYKFMLWAGDSEPDTFRIRIWAENEETTEETVIYDNGNDQSIGGGNIIVHTGKK